MSQCLNQSVHANSQQKCVTNINWKYSELKGHVQGQARREFLQYVLLTIMMERNENN